MKKRRRSRGFTLIELLVVIAIIGILVALVVPAVQHARESVRRTRCQNNMKQLALAMQSYHETHSMFPPGVIDVDGSNQASWAVMLLPFIDQEPLYKEFNTDAVTILTDTVPGTPDVGSITHEQAVATQLAVMRCPSDTVSDVMSVPFLENQGLASDGLARLNYPANGVLINGSLKGLFDYNTSTEMGDIKDGASNTIAIFEKRGLTNCDPIAPATDPATEEAYVWAAWRAGPDMTAADGPLPGTLVESDATCLDGVVNLNGDLSEPNAQPFNSQHSEGGHVALCDGSVKFLIDTIDRDTIILRLINKADGQPIPKY
jgi:prepilin-type N-terminal cleavage/methylation domain-containing protein